MQTVEAIRNTRLQQIESCRVANAARIEQIEARRHSMAEALVKSAAATPKKELASN
jgi:hypothetical protein